MAFRCKIGLHALKNCKCSICGKEKHKWVFGKCTTCRQIRRHYFEFTDLHLEIKPNANLKKIRALGMGLVNIGDEIGFTPLMKASGKEGNLGIVILMVEMGADVNAHAKNGTTALSMAALHGKQDVYDFLISNGAFVDFVLRRS